jgi:hypothetical protein
VRVWDVGAWPYESPCFSRDTARKVERGEPVTGGRTLEELIPGLASRIASLRPTYLVSALIRDAGRGVVLALIFTLAGALLAASCIILVTVSH